MRVNGRTLRPSNLAERRFLLALGVATLRVPRSQNPYSLARRLSRVAEAKTPDRLFVRELVARFRRTPAPPMVPSPEADEPARDDEVA